MNQTACGVSNYTLVEKKNVVFEDLYYNEKTKIKNE